MEENSGAKTKLKPSISAKIRLRWKIFVILAGFIVVILGLIWMFQLAFLDEFYCAMKTKEMKKSAETLEANLDSEGLQVLVNRVSYYDGVTIRIIDGGGTVVAGADAIFSTISTLSDTTLLYKYEIAKEQDNGEYLYTETYNGFMDDGYEDYEFKGNTPDSEGDDATSLIFVKATESESGVPYGIVLDSTITPITATLKTTVYQLLLISVGVLIIAFVIAFVLSKTVVDPIEKLTVSAKELARGKTDVKFDGGGYKEIEELRDSLNYASKEISEVEHLRRELIANVSHDLRTPLTLIKGYSELMADIPSERTAENINVITEETERLGNLVKDMLDLSKLQDGGNKLSLSKFDIVALTSKIAVRFNKLVKAQGYKILFENKTGQSKVIADENKLSQVIYNLIGNAINYAGDDKLVKVRVLTHGRNARVEIIDNGVGIDVDILPHIWDRYYRSDKTHKRASVGTGLGLSIVKTVMTAHPGGVYGVESSKGNGSKFYIELPLTD